MRQINNGSKIASAVIIIIDIIIIDALFILLLQILDIFVLEAFRLFILSISYLINILVGGSITVLRDGVRGDQIIGGVFINVVRTAIIWMAFNAVLSVVYYSLSFYVILFTAIFISLIIFRICCKAVIKRVRSSIRHRSKVVLVGSSINIREIYNGMTANEATGYIVAGYFDVAPLDGFSATYLGTQKEVTSYLERNDDVEQLYCSLPSSMHDDIVSIIAYCENHFIRYFSVPNLRNYLQRRVTLELFGETPILSIHVMPLILIDNRILKRLFDIIFSFFFIVLAFPFIFLIFGTLVKLSSPGPIFFKQKRHGINGKEFWCYKFRSMRVNVNADELQASKDDPRKTRVGDFMRRTNIDELPQFFNVLVGDMSVVGPRPHMLKHTEEYSKLINTYMVRHFIKPGVTGWAQISGFRGETKELADMEGRIKADIWYMEHWTFALDLLIIYKTIFNTFVNNDTKAF